MVQSIKNLLKNAEDPHLAVLSYRATPHPWCKLSPTELSMGQHIRTLVPVTDKHLILTWSYIFQDSRRSIPSARRNKRKILTAIMEFTAYHPFPMTQMYGLTLIMGDKFQGKLCQLLNLRDLTLCSGQLTM